MVKPRNGPWFESAAVTHCVDTSVVGVDTARRKNAGYR